jgi:hypothetical protein
MNVGEFNLTATLASQGWVIGCACDMLGNGS